MPYLKMRSSTNLCSLDLNWFRKYGFLFVFHKIYRTKPTYRHKSAKENNANKIAKHWNTHNIFTHCVIWTLSTIVIRNFWIRVCGLKIIISFFLKAAFYVVVPEVGPGIFGYTDSTAISEVSKFLISASAT